MAARLSDVVDSFTKVGEGLFDRRITGYQNQIAALQDRIDEYEERLEMRRESLFKKFYEMETVLGQLGTQGQFLTNQLAGINANWGLTSQSNK